MYTGLQPVEVLDALDAVVLVVQQAEPLLREWLGHAAINYIISYHIVSYYSMLYYSILYYTTSCYITWCHIMVPNISK